MKHYILLLIAGLLPCLLAAQSRKCLTNQHTAKLQLQKGYTLLDARQNSEGKQIPCDSLIIPIAIHFQGTTAKLGCLDEFVEQQIQILNDDFAGKNLDLIKYLDRASKYPNTQAGYSCIKFRLSDINHPLGFGLVDGMKAITINQLDEGADWEYKWKDYLNLFVFRIGDNVLGYSPLGGRGKGDGVAIAKFAWGGIRWCGDVGQNNSFDKGRTATHEIGHFFGLHHIWGDRTGCSFDDGFDDTPQSEQPNYNCKDHYSCGSLDLSMNFMDYASDECMYMFTFEQVAYMEAYIRKFLPHMVENAFRTISDLQAPHTPIEPPVVIEEAENIDPGDSVNEVEDKPNILLLFVLYLIAALGVGTAFKTKK